LIERIFIEAMWSNTESLICIEVNMLTEESYITGITETVTSVITPQEILLCLHWPNCFAPIFSVKWNAEEQWNGDYPWSLETALPCSLHNFFHFLLSLNLLKKLILLLNDF
jgi:hypothetical protein